MLREEDLLHPLLGTTTRVNHKIGIPVEDAATAAVCPTHVSRSEHV